MFDTKIKCSTFIVNRDKQSRTLSCVLKISKTDMVCFIIASGTGLLGLTTPPEHKAVLISFFIAVIFYFVVYLIMEIHKEIKDG